MIKSSPFRVPWSGGPLALVALMATMLWSRPAQAQMIPSGWNDAQVINGFNGPVGACWDANGRMYVWEKRGKVQIVSGGVVTGTLIDIQPEVGDWRDHGLLGFALDPNFLSNGRIYLMYTVDRHYLLAHDSGIGIYYPDTSKYLEATIMRITRYTAIGPAYNTVDYNSRFVLFGESKKTGAPVTHESHSTGSLVFGADGTLLASMGDGASYNTTDVGSSTDTYYVQALADSIMRPAENVGAMRSQMVNSFSGKVIRIDPNTGDGIPSNPFYDGTVPRSAKSRVWALGLRNPYRMTLRPGTGSSNPADGDPGTLYIGDVGWNAWEDLNVCYEGGMNFGWPLFEGMEAHATYSAATVYDLDEPNPLYDGVNCTQQYFQFKDLLKQDTPNHLNQHPNPCNPAVQIPNGIHKFFHSRPSIDWSHGPAESRCGAFSGNTPITWDLDNASSPVPGPRFGGNASLGGVWVTGATLPAGYQNVYFHADYVAGWIRRFTFNSSDQPTAAFDFASALAPITWIGSGPDGCISYMDYLGNAVRRICPTGTVNLPPVAVMQQSVQYGSSPLSVSFTSTGSSDPESGPLTYLWNFGDGSPTSNLQTPPPHMFTGAGVITRTVTLTVTDNAAQSNQATLIVSLNNTPPSVDINSFVSGSYYPVGVDTTYTLQAAVSDLEHSPAQLTYAWRTILHHNLHIHPEAINPTPITSTVISGAGCDGETYYYEVKLTVTDAGGLSTTDVNYIYPRCQAIAPTAIINASTTAGEAPLAVVFDGSESFDPGSIVSYQWSFGDGATATGPSTSHVFSDTGDHSVSLTVTDNDGLTAQAIKVINVITFDPPQCVGVAGSILREYWTGISGSSVSDLVNSPTYPDSPSGSSFPTTFTGPNAFANDYGTRMRGYILAPEDGNYTFVATSDDNSAFYISLNADPKYKRVVCSVPGWTAVGEFTKYPEQTSAQIYLKAGKYYYVEMLHKEGAGGDFCTMSWKRPSNSTTTTIAGTYLVRWSDCPPSVIMRTNLQGPYDTSNGLMKDDLRTAGLVPATEPFSGLGFTQAGGGGGETVPPAMLTTTGANAIVDWVLVEIRNKNNPTQILATRSALLQRDGDVVGTNGYPRLLFPSLTADNYYVAIRQRNHLGTMTFASTALNKNERGIDFTLGTTATYGTNARKLMTTGKYAQWAGNVVRDNVVKYTNTVNDRDPILTAIGGIVPTNTVNGYLMMDVNLDGVVKYTGLSNDRDVILQNIGGIVPTNTRTEQLP